MAEPTKKLIWRGSSRCRSLRVVVEQHTPIFYVAGDEVPLGVLDQEREDVLVERGLLDRVETKVQPAQRLTPVSPRVFFAPPARSIPTPRPVASPPQTVKVDVGVMTAEIKAGPDKVIGTPDDIVNIRPKGLHSIADPCVEETKTDKVEKKPKSSPTRKRKTKKKKKTAKKGEVKE